MQCVSSGVASGNTAVPILPAAHGTSVVPSSPPTSVTATACRVVPHRAAQYIPRLAANIHNPAPWTSGFELLAMCGGALVIAGSSQSSYLHFPGSSPNLTTTLGQYLFAVSLLVFGTQHFLYARFIATLIPAWIPGHLFWAFFVGVAFFATALAIIFRKRAVLATSLLGLMFFLWVILLHLPRVAASPHNGNEWTSAFVALAMSGSAFVLARTFATKLGE